MLSAVQSRPCPPLSSPGCPSENLSSVEFVPRFVPNLGTVGIIPAHVRPWSKRMVGVLVVSSAGRTRLSSCYSRGFRHIVALSVILAICGCVPTRSTIGGHDEEELKWAVQAGEMCRQRTGQEPPNSFTTDGYTLSPDGTWQSCCVDHDMVCRARVRDAIPVDRQPQDRPGRPAV
jgi:hypothetical protein